MSRPNSSVPSGCPGVSGGWSLRAVATVSGSASGSHGASAASSVTASSTTAPTTARRFRSAYLHHWPRGRAAAPTASGVRDPAIREAAAGATSLTTNLRVERRVEHVDGEIDEHEAERDDEDAALYEREVAGQDPLHHQCADTGPRKDR